MNPWLRELVRTLAAVAVEEIRGFDGAAGPSGGNALTPKTDSGTVVGRATDDAPAGFRDQVGKPRTRK
jgi:hypothetical protein